MRSLRQTAKISSLDAARTIFFIIASLAVRSSLLFFLNADNPKPPILRLWVVSALLFTLFRFSHGIAVIYELEKKRTEQTTSPSSMRVELVFALFMGESIFFYLSAESLSKPSILIALISLLLACDLSYIAVSRTLRDASFLRLLWPGYWVRRWQSTVPGTAPRTHLQWAISDIVLSTCLLLTLVPQPHVLRSLGSSQPESDWLAAIAFFLIVAGICDYWANRSFYFGGIRHKKKKLVFVCSPLKATTALTPDDQLLEMRANIRKAQWYCRQVLRSGNEVPFASHAFYTYFLDDKDTLDRKIGRKCALEFLGNCDAIYLFTPGGSDNASNISAGMLDELDFSQRSGLEIKYFPAEEPPPDFCPVWEPLTANGQAQCRDLDLEKPFRKIFVCSPLHAAEDSDPSTAMKTIRRNIRTAQWLCHELVRSAEGGDRVAAFAPHAFYPYFTDYSPKAGPAGLKTALDILTVCDALYVYTQDGLETDAFITPGMKDCIVLAKKLDLEVKFRLLTHPNEGWSPAAWSPCKKDSAAASASS